MAPNAVGRSPPRSNLPMTVDGRIGSVAITAALSAVAALVTLAAAFAAKRRQAQKLNNSVSKNSALKQGGENGTRGARGGGGGGGSAGSGGSAINRRGAEDSSATVQSGAASAGQWYYAQNASKHVSRHNANLVEWLDEQLGVCVHFSPSQFSIESEERQAPLVILRFKYLRQPAHSVTVTIEECDEEFVSDDQYQADSIARLSGYATILSESTLRAGQKQLPQVEYCYVDENEELIKVTCVFMTCKRYAVAAQYTVNAGKGKKQSVPSAFADLVRNIQFFQSVKPSPSYLFCSEPRLGIGFRVPLHFVSLQQMLALDAAKEESLSSLASMGGGRAAGVTTGGSMEAGGGGDDASFSSSANPFSDRSAFASLISRGVSERAVIVASYEPYSALNYPWQHAVEQILRRAARRFSLRVADSLAIVFCEGTSTPKEMLTREGALVVRPYHIRVSSAGNFSGEDDTVDLLTLPGCFCIQEVLVDTSAMNADMLRGFNGGKRVGITVAYLSVFCVAVGEEYISLSVLSAVQSTSFEQFVAFCTRIVDSTTLGNHLDQNPSINYCNDRHEIQPFQITLTNHMVVEEPPLGDPLAVVYYLPDGNRAHSGELPGVPYAVTVRVFPCSRDIAVGSSAMTRFEKDVAGWIKLLPGRTALLGCRQSLLRGCPAIEVVFEQMTGDDVATNVPVYISEGSGYCSAKTNNNNNNGGSGAAEVYDDDEYTSMNPFTWYHATIAHNMAAADSTGEEKRESASSRAPTEEAMHLFPSQTGYLSNSSPGPAGAAATIDGAMQPSFPKRTIGTQSVVSRDDYGSSVMTRVAFIVCIDGLAFLFHTSSPSRFHIDAAVRSARQVAERTSFSPVY